MNTTYFLNLVMGNLFHTKKDVGLPDGYYLGLSTSAPSIDGSGVTEPVAEGYARVKINGLSTPSGGVIRNNAPIIFEESLEAWGIITHYVVFDAETGGNLLFYGVLKDPMTVGSATTVTVKANALTITLGGAAQV